MSKFVSHKWLGALGDSFNTVVPVMNGHPRDQATLSVHCRWPLIRGNLTLKYVGRGIDNVAVQGRWPLTTGVAQGRYYCTVVFVLTNENDISGVTGLHAKHICLAVNYNKVMCKQTPKIAV